MTAVLAVSLAASVAGALAGGAGTLTGGAGAGVADFANGLKYDQIDGACYGGTVGTGGCYAGIGGTGGCYAGPVGN